MPGIVNLLKQADIFYQVPPEYLEQVAVVCREVTCKAGDEIFAEESQGDELYIIAQGEIEIKVNPSLVAGKGASPLAAVTIATLRRGQSFGEIALVDQGVRSAAACASLENTRLLVIARQDLNRICEDHPAFGYLLMRNLAADLALKLRNTNLLIRSELLNKTRI